MDQGKTMTDDLLFDIWHNDKPQGMTKGKTPAAARALVKESRPDIADTCLLVPYYGAGTTFQTYEALIGRKANNIFGLG